MKNVKVRPHSHRLQLRILIKTALRCSTATSCPGSVHPEQSSSPSKHGGCLETLSSLLEERGSQRLEKLIVKGFLDLAGSYNKSRR